MSRNIVRGFQTSSKTLIQHVGASLEEVATSNGSEGAQWSAVTSMVCDKIEKADPQITAADIQGSKAHLSSKDRSDKQNVLTVGLQTHKGTRVGSVHIHADGTFKFLASRVGREGGYSATIAQANIPGYIAGDNDTLRDGDKGSSSKK